MPSPKVYQLFDDLKLSPPEREYAGELATELLGHAIDLMGRLPVGIRFVALAAGFAATTHELDVTHQKHPGMVGVPGGLPGEPKPDAPPSP